MTDNQAMEITEGLDWKARYMDAQARVVERDQRIHELSSRPTMDAYLAACRALHWHTAQLRANGIEPDPIEPDAPHYPPDGHVFSATPAAGDAEVERVAEAMADDSGLDWPKLPDHRDMACGHGMPEGCKDYWRALAKAAIKALAE